MDMDNQKSISHGAGEGCPSTDIGGGSKDDPTTLSSSDHDRSWVDSQALGRVSVSGEEARKENSRRNSNISEVSGGSDPGFLRDELPLWHGCPTMIYRRLNMST